MKNTYLVTGGAGFIGSNIAERLASEGETVRILDNFCYGFRENVPEGAEIIEGDMGDPKAVEKAVEGADYVFHEAAIAPVPDSIRDPAGTHRANLTGTVNLLEACRNSSVKKVVFASSAAIYGNNPDTVKKETSQIDLLSPYAVQKYASELYMKNYNDVFGIKTIALRYFNIFGPRQNLFSDYGAVIPKFIDIMSKGGVPTIFGDGEQSRDFLFVENVVDANMLALKSKASGVALNIGSGKSVTINGLVEKLNRIFGTSISAKHAEPREGDVRTSQADISLARKLIGFEPRVSFDEGLKKTVEHNTCK